VKCHVLLVLLTWPPAARREMAIILRIELKLQDFCGSYFTENGISTGNANDYFKDNGIDLQNPKVWQSACLPIECPPLSRGFRLCVSWPRARRNSGERTGAAGGVRGMGENRSGEGSGSLDALMRLLSASNPDSYCPNPGRGAPVGDHHGQWGERERKWESGPGMGLGEGEGPTGLQAQK